MLKSIWVSNFGSNLTFFKILNMKGSNLANDKMTKIKVVDINELNNFGIHHILC